MAPTEDRGMAGADSVLVLAPRRDRELTSEYLHQGGITTAGCDSFHGLLDAIVAGPAGAGRAARRVPASRLHPDRGLRLVSWPAGCDRRRRTGRGSARGRVEPGRRHRAI